MSSIYNIINTIELEHVHYQECRLSDYLACIINIIYEGGRRIVTGCKNKKTQLHIHVCCISVGAGGVR